MQHRLKRGRGFIIRNANREAAALRVPPVFEGGACINDDAALTTTTPSMSLSHATARTSPGPTPGVPSAFCLFPRRRPHWGRSARASRASEQPPPSHYCAAAQPPPNHRPAITAPPPSRRQTTAQPPAHPPPTLVSDPKHLSHTATLRFTNTDISSVPYKTP